MANIQCKMCGGSVELPDGVTSGECPYCGSVTTFPKLNSEQKEHLYTRAEHFRQANNFDKAVASYEALLNLDAEDPEAYWGLLISRYGIEYVEDPATHERIPTCHRVQYESILADSDYQNALKYASGSDREIYEKEAQRISEIQKGILRISAQEKPYDVFICYKETTDGGTRTKDSTLAQDIYYQLTNQGLKVFFSRITLEDKLGQQYEPYIFAALNSAKVMLVIGSKKEYFEAVWVKNEWSRFLALMKKDRSKLLIPCFKDMDPYDIPEELSMFQCQDMSKIGFVQDILHGIMKVANEGKSKESNASSINNESRAFDVSKLMKRVSILLDQQDWDNARTYCMKGLEEDPENSDLYLMLCMINHKVSAEGDFATKAFDLAKDKNFAIAIKFASPERKKILETILDESMVNLLLQQCANQSAVSNISELPHSSHPLIQNSNFQEARKIATPERKKELDQLVNDQVDYFLGKFLTDNHISNLSDLPNCNILLSQSQTFQTAIICAPSERKQDLLQLQDRQCDYFLKKAIDASFVSSEKELMYCDNPIIEDSNFKKALISASLERRQELLKIQSAQRDVFLQKVMDANCASTVEDLKRSITPLKDDPNFKKALVCATEAQRKEMEQLPNMQSDYHLSQFMQKNGISSPAKIPYCSKKLMDDPDFKLALDSAPEGISNGKKLKLKACVITQQSIIHTKRIVKGIIVVFITTVIIFIGLLLIAVFWDTLSLPFRSAEKIYELAELETPSTPEAFKLYKMSAKKGYVPAQAMLGFCYSEGLGVEKDLYEAVKWNREAAEHGNVSAQFNLGLCYSHGDGVAQDYLEAAKWYRKAAEQGHIWAQVNLGNYYYNGLGVEKDLIEAAKWWREAAEKGDPIAQNSLAACYYNGYGVRQDKNEGFKWGKKAAEQGNAEAQYNLADSYFEGDGVKQDKNEALKWWRKAAEQGYEPAKKRLKELGY